jgi:hypothetical protein
MTNENTQADLALLRLYVVLFLARSGRLGRRRRVSVRVRDDRRPRFPQTRGKPAELRAAEVTIEVPGDTDPNVLEEVGIELGAALMPDGTSADRPAKPGAYELDQGEGAYGPDTRKLVVEGSVRANT